MVFIDLATGFFRRNARSGGVAEGGCGGEFRRARAFRRSEAEAVSFVQNRFGLCRIIAPVSSITIEWIRSICSLLKYFTLFLRQALEISTVTLDKIEC